MVEINMIDTKLKVGDIIVITDSETVNYLQVGKVVNIRPYKNPDDISEKDVNPYITNESKIKYEIKCLKERCIRQNKYPYVVEYNLSDVNYAGEYSHCHLHITTECYDESLPRKSIILYREEE